MLYIDFINSHNLFIYKALRDFIKKRVIHSASSVVTRAKK